MGSRTQATGFLPFLSFFEKIAGDMLSALLTLSGFFPLWFTPLRNQINIIPGTGPLAEAFSSGKFEWNDILLYGLYLIELLLLAAGLTAIIGIMLGGFRYIFGSLVEDKEKGRDTIKHTLIGFVLVVLAWGIVDLIITLLTSG